MVTVEATMRVVLRTVAGLLAAGSITMGLTAPSAQAAQCDAFVQPSPQVHLTIGATTRATILVDVPVGCTQRGPIRVQLVPDREAVTRTLLVTYRESYPAGNPTHDRWGGVVTFQNNQGVAALYELRVLTLDVGLPTQSPPTSFSGITLQVVRATSLRATALTPRILPYGSSFRLSGRLGRYLGTAGNLPFPRATVRLWAQRSGQAERVVDVTTTAADGTFRLDFPVRATETLSVRYQQVDFAVAGARLPFGTARVG
jgi:hypothetical protein